MYKLKKGLVLIFLLLPLFLMGQATITIEVNWPNWSSENRVTFRNSSNAQIGNTICNPSACFNGAGNNSYNNLGSPEVYTNVPYGTSYNLLLQDTWGDGWNGFGSYVRVYQDGILIVQSDLTNGTSGVVTFDINAPSPRIEISDVTIDEDGGNAIFTATHLNAATSSSFSVNYETTNGTATNSEDYTTTSGTLNFNGSINDSETIVIPIIDDALVENNSETFTINLISTTDSSVDISDVGNGTIIDDDGIIIDDGSTETTCSGVFLDSGGLGGNYSNNEDITFTICPDSGDFTMVDFTSFDVPVGDVLYVYNGTNTGGGNLIGQYDNSNLPSAIGSTSGNGCLTFRFVSNGSTTGEGWEATVTCQEDGPMIVINDISFDEDAGVAIFTVTQTREAHGFTFFGVFIHRPFTVDFQTVDGTATAGLDYTATSGTITFNGEIGNTQSISVPISVDAIPEEDEYFTIEFTGADANFATINYADTGRGTINSQISGNVPLTLFRQFDGKYDYSTTGGTLRSNDNNTDPCSINTSSSNTLLSPIPATSSIRAAYLYWAHSETTRDDNVTFEGQPVTANYLYQTSLTTRNFFGYMSDVTSIVTSVADPTNNTWDFTDLTIDNTGDYCSTATVLGAWALIIFYEDATLPAVNINLYQGFDGLSNAGTSFTLDSFYAISGNGAKATFLSYEGDSTLDGSSSGSTNPEELSITNQGGTTSILTGDGGQTGNNSYNSTIYDNTVNPVSNNPNAYGIDLDTYDISTFISPADSQVTANVDVGQDFVISSAVVLKVPSNLISGTVFEDINYPGGAGRNYVTSNGNPIVAATVELFDSSGNFVDRVFTDASGFYSFGGMPDGTYFIRVVNSTVRSTRGGGLNCSSCYPVQTFRSFGNATSITEITTEVGGANPTAFQDTSLGVLTGAQSVSTVTVASTGVTNIDFGFNFNTIVNTNDTGQGSIEQFIINANNLDETGLDIQANSIFNPSAGEDTSIFMIPSSSDPLGRTADSNISNGYFDIEVSAFSPLSSLIDDNTVIDGRTQTAYSGDTNLGSVTVSSATVGVSNIALPNYNLPEIQVRGNGGDILKIQGNNTAIRYISIYANNNAGIRVDGGSVSVIGNLLGVNAEGTNSGNIDVAVENLGGDVVIDSNYIATNTDSGILIDAGSSNIIQNNAISDNGDAACDDNILITGGSGIQIQQNLIENASSLGIDAATSSGAIIISENTIAGSGQNGGNCGGEPKQMGIELVGSNSQITNNVIYSNGGAGIAITGSGNENLISQNAIYANGTASDALGIDLNNDGVTLNDNNDADTGANDLLNFPIITAVNLSGTNVIITGWSRPGATLEFFLSDINEGSASTGDNQLGNIQDYGEGQIYFGSATEGGVEDGSSSVTSYTDMDGNNDNTNYFQFVIPLPPGTNLGEIITSTATLSNSTSEFSPGYAIKAARVITNRRITYRVNQ